MTFQDRVRARVLFQARRRLLRELCRALACGLTRRDVVELLDIAAAADREARPEPRLPDPGRGVES